MNVAQQAPPPPADDLHRDVERLKFLAGCFFLGLTVSVTAFVTSLLWLLVHHLTGF